MYFSPPNSGFEYGFETWKIVPGIAFDYERDPYITSDKLTPLAIEELTEVSKQDHPWVAWYHYMDIHDTYFTHPESPHFGPNQRDLYDEEVFYTDLWIGKLLAFVDAQPWAKKTAVVVTADHGEAFGEHNAWHHAHEVWEEPVRVLLLRARSRARTEDGRCAARRRRRAGHDRRPGRREERAADAR